MIAGQPVDGQMVVEKAKREITFYATQFGNRDEQAMRAVPGCFTKSIEERLPEGSIKLCRNHATFNNGLIRHLAQDDYGLLAVGRVSKTQAGDEMLEQCADGSLTHASYRGSALRWKAVLDGEDEYGQPIETIDLLEVKLKECGPCDFDPVNSGARILAVNKSLERGFLDDLRELPMLLKKLTLTRGRALTGDERKAAKGLLALKKSLNEQSDLLEALLAPGSATLLSRGAPDRPTQEAVEKADRERDGLLQLIRARGQR